MKQSALPARGSRVIRPGLIALALLMVIVLLTNGLPWFNRLLWRDDDAARSEAAPVRTELVHTTVQRPDEGKPGACETHSVFAPRADAWRCRIEGAVYDPCFETTQARQDTAGAEVATEPGVIVCGAEPLSGARGFYVRGVLPPARASSDTPDIDPAQLESLSFTLDLVGRPVTLTRGQYYLPWVEQAQGSLLVGLSELRAHGDLDGDGDQDQAVLLVADAADDRMFIYLGAVLNDNGEARAGTLLLLGDRVTVDNLLIRNGQIVVFMTTHTPDDPACCPTMDVEYHYVLREERLRQVVDGWRLELAGGVQCQPVLAQPDGSDAHFAYQCSDGAWLRSGLNPGRLWTATRAGTLPQPDSEAAEASSPATPVSLLLPVVRVWQ